MNEGANVDPIINASQTSMDSIDQLWQDDPAVGSLITNAREKKQADVNGYLRNEVVLEKADMQDVEASMNVDIGEAHNNKASDSDLSSQL
ncbi:Oidioi.mRNA.OKI2018_I69.chr1.g362.t1.cds [Oikopleura dioica]|uniref:Oidioi.mRNA.OKI2018_I69.chr1.g362.t1.cds n=1 Tax=Oikopleura dioica TaxID=34765 RepID=A0ABN7SNV4_OIKDI|nr:Oidioi.mRNA.OKI2018_I69.chr1.g362.t1.cds [Oikopleura dioica]